MPEVLSFDPAQRLALHSKSIAFHRLQIGFVMEGDTLPDNACMHANMTGNLPVPPAHKENLQNMQESCHQPKGSGQGRLKGLGMSIRMLSPPCFTALEHPHPGPHVLELASDG